MSINAILPIGISDFGELVKYRNSEGIGFAFIDKTLLIKEILLDGSKVIVLPRPRRFGKTLNLSMLQHFFAPTVRGKSTKGLFDNLAIASHQDCMKDQGQYPVIFITFKEAKYSSLDKLDQGIRIIIANVYLAFEYLLSSEALKEEEKIIFKLILAKKASEGDLSLSLLYLSKFITAHHGVKPYILIDEYDIPIQEAYLKGYYREAVDFIRPLFSAVLKDNPYIAKAVLTGIVRVSKESLFSGLNNIMIYSILSKDEYSSFFGFLEPEVCSLLEKFNISADKALIREWYNGYKFGANSNIYNPWSILNCIKKNGELQSYWINTSSNALVKTQVEIASARVKGKIRALIQGEEITENISESFVFEDLGKGQVPMWSLLVLTGYLKVVEAKALGQRHMCKLAIPNKEIEDFYKVTVEDWISQPLGMDWFHDLLNDLTNAEIEGFSEKLNEFILESASFFDASKDKQEAFYHGLTLGLVAGLKDNYVIKSNRESGLGRYDLVLIPHDKTRIGIIMEFKASKDKKIGKKRVSVQQNKSKSEDKEINLEQDANEALAQALNNQYQVEVKQAGVEKIVAIGIAFSLKQVWVSYKVL